jgi:hypothetical protein
LGVKTIAAKASFQNGRYPESSEFHNTAHKTDGNPARSQGVASLPKHAS